MKFAALVSSLVGLSGAESPEILRRGRNNIIEELYLNTANWIAPDCNVKVNDGVVWRPAWFYSYALSNDRESSWSLCWACHFFVIAGVLVWSRQKVCRWFLISVFER